MARRQATRCGSGGRGGGGRGRRGRGGGGGGRGRRGGGLVGVGDGNSGGGGQQRYYTLVRGAVERGAPVTTREPALLPL